MGYNCGIVTYYTTFCFLPACVTKDGLPRTIITYTIICTTLNMQLSYPTGTSKRSATCEFFSQEKFECSRVQRRRNILIGVMFVRLRKKPNQELVQRSCGAGNSQTFWPAVNRAVAVVLMNFEFLLREQRKIVVGRNSFIN